MNQPAFAGDLFGAMPDPASIEPVASKQPAAEDDIAAELGQWMTPAWAAEELTSIYFGDLSARDHVLEPSCGTGAFLAALPEHVPAFGVEIDAALAEQARNCSGRPVVVGDFLATEIPFTPTAIIGNPPFKQSLVQAFFERAWDLLPVEGRVGFVLPCYIFQTASVVSKLSRKWGMRQDMIPRNVFQGLHLPLCFAQLTKGAGRGMVGFTLYHETDAVTSLRKRYRAMLDTGEKSVWAAVTLSAIEALGGEASLPEIYGEIEGNQPTETPFWREKVRQTLQRRAVQRTRGRWALPETLAA
jgi:site-specific DNA-methyltransferase (adenine-specific)